MTHRAAPRRPSVPHTHTGTATVRARAATRVQDTSGAMHVAPAADAPDPADARRRHEHGRTRRGAVVSIRCGGSRGDVS